jgi:hypothetical protein
MSLSFRRMPPDELAEVFSGLDIGLDDDRLDVDLPTQSVKLRSDEKRIDLRAIGANLHGHLRLSRTRSMAHAK